MREATPWTGPLPLLVGRALQLLKFCGIELCIVKDLGEQADADDLALVNGHNRAPPIRMLHKVVAALDPGDDEARLLQFANYLFASNPRCASHCPTAIRWSPMN